MGNKRWSTEENNILRKYYVSKGSKYCQKYLSRSRRAINLHAQVIGIKNYEHISWTKKEILYLEENYKNYSWKKIAKTLNRTVASVKTKAKLLRVIKRNPKPWTQKELKYLRKNYNNLTLETLAKDLNRTIKSIEGRAFQENLTYREFWTKKEDLILKKHRLKSATEIKTLLPHRSETAINCRITKLGFIERKIKCPVCNEIFIKNHRTQNTCSRVCQRYFYTYEEFAQAVYAVWRIERTISAKQQECKK